MGSSIVFRIIFNKHPVLKVEIIDCTIRLQTGNCLITSLNLFSFAFWGSNYLYLFEWKEWENHQLVIMQLTNLSKQFIFSCSNVYLSWELAKIIRNLKVTITNCGYLLLWHKNLMCAKSNIIVQIFANISRFLKQNNLTYWQFIFHENSQKIRKLKVTITNWISIALAWKFNVCKIKHRFANIRK